MKKVRFSKNVKLSKDGKTLKKVSGIVGEYVVPDTVTEIMDDAFRDCVGLTSVVIPDSVVSIGDSAFWGCSNLLSVRIPDSVVKIDDSAFWDCISLSDVFIPDTVEYIGDNIFYGCENLNKHIVVNDVFVWASRDTKGSFVVPKGIRRIAGGAFDGLADLTSVVISEGVTEIGWSAFRFCRRLHSVEMPSTLLKI
ncbi:MAG: leucine-rich repeat domain-containing protein [Bacteroidaceae bacterium]|nr:leucine-rich repeat domain-containing protein [Bacteroidaceae bacterium]